MPDFYYMDLYFDPDVTPLVDVVDSCVNAIIQSGCDFKKIIIPADPSHQTTKNGRFGSVGLEHLRSTCQLCQDEMLGTGATLFSYPPRWGRIVFEHDFTIDEDLSDEVYDEEDETGAKCSDLGLSFQFFNHEGMGRKIKMTMNFWEDFILRRGTPETHQKNINFIVHMLETINYAVGPYFGAMNTELKLNSDHSLDLLMKGEVPEGNDFVFIGEALAKKINVDELDRRGITYREFSDGSLLIQFTDHFGSVRAF